MDVRMTFELSHEKGCCGCGYLFFTQCTEAIFYSLCHIGDEPHRTPPMQRTIICCSLFPYTINAHLDGVFKGQGLSLLSSTRKPCYGGSNASREARLGPLK